MTKHDSESTLPRNARPEGSGAGGDSATPGGVADDAQVWLVSFGDEDDRELKAPEIAAALLRAEINATTIVWREGFEDWVLLSSVPALARLLPATGETATAPRAHPIASGSATAASPARDSKPPLPKRDSKAPGEGRKSNPPLQVRASRPPPPLPVRDSKIPPPLDVAKSAARDSKPPLPKRESKPPPDAGGATTTAAQWKGSTRLGLPQVGGVPAPDAPKVGVARTPDAPKVGVARAPDAPKVGVARTPDAPKVEPSPASSRALGPTGNIWGNNDDEAPISIDPESFHPASPAPALTAARALSAGTLGLAKKALPTAPRPPVKPTPPPPADDAEQAPESGTPALRALARAPSQQGDRAVEDFLGFGSGGPGLLGAAPVDLAALTTDAPPSAPPESVEAETQRRVAPAAPEAGTPTIPLAATTTAASTSSRPAKSSAVPVATEKKRSVAPFWLLGAAAAVLVTVALRGPGAASKAPQEMPTPPREEAAHAVTPAPVAPPEPAAPASAAPIPESAPPGPTPSLAAPTPALTAQTPALTAATPATPTPSKGSVPSEAPKLPAAPAPEAAKEAAAAGKPAASAATMEKKPEPVAEAPAPPPEVEVGGEFDKGAASEALTAAAAQAAGCRKEGDPSGVAVVRVTFANGGRATRATIEGPPFAGTATGGCIASAMRQAKVPPYGGDRVTVTKRVTVQ